MNPSNRNFEPGFDERGRLIAPRFDDVYFSAQDGLAETRHVFLQGNDLIGRFEQLNDRANVVVGETGFGTGLNFLAVSDAFTRHAPASATLDFVSVEGYPLATDVLRRALVPWPELAQRAEQLAGQWHAMIPGTHRLLFDGGRVRLTVLVGDAAAVLAQRDDRVDAWLLDGFAPAKNPGMWSEAVFAQLARLSAPGASLATYTAAGFVRRGLAAAGFSVQKRPGFGRKRDMTVGRYEPTTLPHDVTPSADSAVPRSAIVIGGGLAGCAASRSLAEAGLAVTLIDGRGIASGASSTPRAIVQPVIADPTDRLGRYARAAYTFATRRLESLSLSTPGAIDLGGLVHLIDDAKSAKARAFVGAMASDDFAQWVEPAQAAQLLVHDGPRAGVYFPRAGHVDPAALCHALADHPGVDIVCGQQADAIEPITNGCRVRCGTAPPRTADVVVLATAHASARFAAAGDLPLRPVAGQVLVLPAGRTPISLLRPVYFGRYLIPPSPNDPRAVLGATFHRHATAIPDPSADSAALLDDLRLAFPRLYEEMDTSAAVAWSGVRCTAPDHAPIIGPSSQDNILLSIAHGSRGVISSLFAAELLTCHILGRGAPLEADLLEAIDPGRFARRAARRK